MKLVRRTAAFNDGNMRVVVEKKSVPSLLTDVQISSSNPELTFGIVDRSVPETESHLPATVVERQEGDMYYTGCWTVEGGDLIEDCRCQILEKF